MSILVVGSIALDTIETPHGRADDSLGGSALYFSAGASLFTGVDVVGVVGTDFDFSPIKFMKKRNVDFSGLEVQKGKTFRWGGKYKKNINLRDTLFTDLNVFQNFRPKIPNHYLDDSFVFLANIDPELQLDVLEQLNHPRLSVLDTMNFWISGKPEALRRLIRKVDVLILNDEELHDLTDMTNVFHAAKSLLQQGPRAVVVKKGEHGAILVGPEGYFIAPAFPVDEVIDPTGAGDSFAGGFLGYLSTCRDINHMNLRRAVAYGTVVASFAVEDFSFNRLKEISREDLELRVQKLREITAF